MMNGNLASLPLGETRICDDCGERAVRVSFREQGFIYGDGSEAVELSARLPVWICGHCEHGYTDGDAEDLRHEAVCRHLGVLSPEQIRAIRKHHGMTQAQFADVTGFGIASVKRWETGALIQNQSADRLLRLIAGDPGIMTRLIAIEVQVITPSFKSTFRTPISDETRAAAKIFVLRPTGT
jgi:putative zinc finger/helix-turn-helix YgiT family protein